MIRSLLFLGIGMALPAQDPAPDPRTLAEQGKVDEATAAWRARIEAEPKNPDHRVGLVHHLRDHDRLNDAIDACQDALRAIPKHYDLLLLMARLCQRKGEVLGNTPGGRGTAAMYFEDVVKYAGHAKALAPARREPRALRGMSLFGLGRTDQAEKEADELCEKFPEHPGGFILRGEVLFDRYQVKVQGRKIGAKERRDLVQRIRDAFTTAAALDGERVVPHRRLGDLEAWEGRTQKALDHWADGLARDPQRGAPLSWLADNVANDKRAAFWDRAIQRFDELGTEPASKAADLHWNAGLVRYALGEWAACKTHMEKCYGLRKDYLNALFWFGLAAFQLGREDDALIAFGMYAQRSPEKLAAAIAETGEHTKGNVGIVSRFADLAHQRANLSMSRDLNHAIAIVEDTPERWNNYAFLCRETGQYEQSWSAYRKALDKTPEDPQLLNDAAVILQYHLRRDLDDARRMYLAAIEIAKKRTRDPKTSRADKKRFAQALQDARGNLIKMNRERKGKR